MCGYSLYLYGHSQHKQKKSMKNLVGTYKEGRISFLAMVHVCITLAQLIIRGQQQEGTISNT